MSQIKAAMRGARGAKDITRGSTPENPIPFEELVHPIYRVGEAVSGKGIFIGVIFREVQGPELARPDYDIFAAPRDLQDPDAPDTGLTFARLEALLKKRATWEGHGFLPHTKDSDIYETLLRQSYKGEWVLPSLVLLCGWRTASDQVASYANLYACKDRGVLAGTFAQEAYWSSTRAEGYNTHVVNFKNGQHGIWADTKSAIRGRCRPMRLEKYTAESLAAWRKIQFVREP